GEFLMQLSKSISVEYKEKKYNYLIDYDSDEIAASEIDWLVEEVKKRENTITGEEDYNKWFQNMMIHTAMVRLGSKINIWPIEI
nr:hypothetical protein [Treponema sp.]